MFFSKSLTGRLYEAAGILCFISSLIYLLILVSYDLDDPSWTYISNQQPAITNIGGQFGAWLADISFSVCGIMAYSIPILLGYASWVYFNKSTDSSIFNNEKGIKTKPAKAKVIATQPEVLIKHALSLTRCLGVIMLILA